MSEKDVQVDLALHICYHAGCQTVRIQSVEKFSISLRELPAFQTQCQWACELEMPKNTEVTYRNDFFSNTVNPHAKEIKAAPSSHRAYRFLYN